jgi:hypothetical protein
MVVRRVKWYFRDVARELETRLAVALVNIAESKMARR